jgi:putative Holliday junction resolvase
MGLDVGDRRIGVAVSDPLGITAQGLPTLERVSLKEDIRALAELVKAWDVGLIAAGLPINMNGTHGPQSEKVKGLADRLREAANVDVVYWDERLTTAAANRSMLEGDLSRKKRKRAVDRVAAVLILQGYLDYARPTESGGRDDE